MGVVICIIDKGIIENASGKSKMVESMKNSLVELVSRPHKFLMGKPFGLIYVSCPPPSSLFVDPATRRRWVNKVAFGVGFLVALLWYVLQRELH